MKRMNFGLPVIKQEGMCSSFDHPEILPWPGCGKEFRAYFKTKYQGVWYLRPFLFILRRIAVDAWDNALLENAKREKGSKDD